MKNSCTESLSTSCLPSVSHTTQLIDITHDRMQSLVREGGIQAHFSSKIANEKYRPKRGTYTPNISGLYKILKDHGLSRIITKIEEICQKPCLLICLPGPCYEY